MDEVGVETGIDYFVLALCAIVLQCLEQVRLEWFVSQRFLGQGNIDSVESIFVIGAIIFSLVVVITLRVLRRLVGVLFGVVGNVLLTIR